MRILRGQKLKDYKAYLVDKAKFLKVENDKLKDKLKEYCKQGEHDFGIEKIGWITYKVCYNCPMTMRIKNGI